MKNVSNILRNNMHKVFKYQSDLAKSVRLTQPKGNELSDFADQFSTHFFMDESCNNVVTLMRYKKNGEVVAFSLNWLKKDHFIEHILCSSDKIFAILYRLDIILEDDERFDLLRSVFNIETLRYVNGERNIMPSRYTINQDTLMTLNTQKLIGKELY